MSPPKPHTAVTLLAAFSLAGALSSEAYQFVEPNESFSLGSIHSGSLDVDTRLMDNYGPPPAATRTFYLNSRAHLASSPTARIDDAEVVQLAISAGRPLLSGPMLGDVSATGAAVWFRASNGETLRLKVTGPDLIPQSFTSSVNEPGIPQTIRASGLSPDTAYTYEIVDSAEAVLGAGSFRTFPLATSTTPFRLAFGADFHKVGLHNPNLFHQILKRGPLAMLLYGDSATDGRQNRINMHEADYLLRDVSPAWSNFAANLPLYATWDDWDYYSNDASGVQGDRTESVVDELRELWDRNWNNPERDEDRDGIYFSTRIGEVEVFMLDTRSCREPSRRGQYACYLGTAQQEWLKQALRDSTATFKILSSGTMWSDYVSEAKDSWGTWDVQGREEIFSLIENEGISGILLISGDRHGARAFRIPRTSGFEFYEFGVGSLGGVSGPGSVDAPEQIFGYAGRDILAFGEFEFEFSLPDPRVTFHLINDRGLHVESLTLLLSQLTPGLAASATLIAPAPGSFALTHQPIALAATASSDSSSVTRVEFFAGTTSIGLDIDGSDGWSASWVPTSPGNYSVVAVSTAANGQSVTSSPHAITIAEAGTQGGSVIWQESFTDLDDGAIVDSGVTAWSVSGSPRGLYVLGGELSGKHLKNTTYTWASEPIDISKGEASFSVDLRAGDVTTLEGADFVKISYKVDGQPPVLANQYLGQAIGSGTTTFEQGGLVGSQLEIIIEVKNSAANEVYFLDNIMVRIGLDVGYSDVIFQSWRENAPPHVIVDPTEDGFTDKANGLLENGLVYAFGINSLDPALLAGKLPEPEVVQVDGGAQLRIRLSRRAGGSSSIIEANGYTVDGMSYFVERSSTMEAGDWHSGADQLELIGLPISNGDGSETLTVQSKHMTNGNPVGRDFIRVRVVESGTD